MAIFIINEKYREYDTATNSDSICYHVILKKQMSTKRDRQSITLMATSLADLKQQLIALRSQDIPSDESI